MSNSHGGGTVALVLAPVVCCAGLVLAAGGGLGWVLAWLLDGGLAWIAATTIVVGVGLVLWRRRSHPAATSDEAQDAPPAIPRGLPGTMSIERPMAIARSKVRTGGHQDSPTKGAA